MADMYEALIKNDKLGNKQSNNLYNMLIGKIIDHEAKPLSTITIFLDNKQKLKETKDGTQDKRFHARANAQAGQIYDISTAMGLSLGREAWDLLRKNTWERKSETGFLNTIKDSSKDLQADFYGLGQGMLHPLTNVNSILDYKYLDGLNH